MINTVKDDVRKNGFAFLSQYLPTMDTSAVAIELGQPLELRGSHVQELLPRVNSTPNTYGGIFGLHQLPFHTDLAHWRRPPRYIILRCITGFEDVCTLMLDGQRIVDAVTEDFAVRAIFRPRRPMDGVLRLLRLLELTEDGRCFRWDQIFLKPASKIGTDVSQQVAELVQDSRFLSIALMRPGDTLVIDNWRMLHARTSIHPEYELRRLQRVYLERLH